MSMTPIRRFALLATFMAALPLSAQTSRYAVHGAVNASTLQYRDPSVSGCANCFTFGITGFDVGASALRELYPWFALEAGLSYSSKGAILAGNYTLRLHYLETPIAARVTATHPAYGVRPYALAGLAPARRVSCDAYDFASNPGPPPGGTRSSETVCSSYGDRDLGMLFGGGVQINRGRMEYRAEFRRTIGADMDPDVNRSLRNDVRSAFLIAQFRTR
jgi:hypothetical protein